ncbi:hypothetical protein BX661DRAFT_221516 [Kickxella alabastrina]|uniref:uncharacterized protein n=1 Tax=Kickxella alabastrina TaxID=61397 RepID=UPI00221FBB15|nr:uncharacterized protein BX661DRAFT_221516 [Kickxella alabastrina]KAI7834513.1 hypothetical protein BX661DRAFT_221516 [Kickxella alabastrina]
MSTYGNSRPALGENSSYYAAEYQPEQRAGQSSQYLPPYEHYNQVATEAAWLYRDYKKSRDNKRNDKYQHNMPGHKSQHRRNNSNSAPGIRSYEDTYGHHGKY